MGLSAYITTKNSGHLGRPLFYHIKRINKFLENNASVSLDHPAEFYKLDEYTDPQYITGAIFVHLLLQKGGLPLLLKVMSDSKDDKKFEAVIQSELLKKGETLNTFLRKQYKLLAGRGSFSSLLRVTE